MTKPPEISHVFVISSNPTQQLIDLDVNSLNQIAEIGDLKSQTYVAVLIPEEGFFDWKKSIDHIKSSNVDRDQFKKLSEFDALGKSQKYERAISILQKIEHESGGDIYGLLQYFFEHSIRGNKLEIEQLLERLSIKIPGDTIMNFLKDEYNQSENTHYRSQSLSLVKSDLIRPHV